MNTIQEVSKDTLQIEAYIAIKNPGDTIKYSEIEKESGVKMDLQGKQKMRTALKRLKLEYECVRGSGIILASSNSVSRIMAHRMTKIDRTVRRGEKSHKNLGRDFFNQLDSTEQKQMIFLGSIFGAIRAYSKNGKRTLAERKMNNLDSPII